MVEKQSRSPVNKIFYKSLATRRGCLLGAGRRTCSFLGVGRRLTFRTSTCPRVIPKVKAKPKLAPATGAVPRRTSLLPAFTRFSRAELELLATQWEIDCNGLTMGMIQDRLFLLDTELVQGRHQGGSQ